MHYYNEIDSFCVQWLKNLIDADLIPKGEVDDRSIEDVRPSDLHGFTQCHFFAGLGGWAYALQLAGVPDSTPLWTGSCPCQPFSSAGKGKGFADERHLWPAWFWLIEQSKPPIVLGEQVDKALGWFDLVSTDLEASGYAVAAAIIPAASVGAIHNRPRLWFVADSQWDQQSWEEPRRGAVGRVGRERESVSWDTPWESALREFRAVDDGLSYGVAGPDATRNAIVPQVAEKFIRAALV